MAGGLVDLRTLDERTKVHVEEWDGYVFLRPMSGLDHQRFLKLGQADAEGRRTVDAADLFGFQCEVCADCVVDHSGDPLHEDVEWWARCLWPDVRKRLFSLIIDVSMGTPPGKKPEGEDQGEGAAKN